MRGFRFSPRPPTLGEERACRAKEGPVLALWLRRVPRTTKSGSHGVGWLPYPPEDPVAGVERLGALAGSFARARVRWPALSLRDSRRTRW